MPQRLIADDRRPSAGKFPVRLLVFLVLLAVLFGGLFRIRRRVIARILKFPPPECPVTVERAIPITMPDGITLYADHYVPQGGEPFPTILIRTPYGRASDAVPMLRRFQDQLYLLFAERGYHVIVQSVRGRFLSEGVFEPFVNEATDGRTTLEWIAAQPWFDGNLGMWGASYVGYTQWAVSGDAPPYLKAIVPLITSTRFSKLFYPGGAFAFESALRWIYLTKYMVNARRMLDFSVIFKLDPKATNLHLAPIFAARPLADADQRAIGETNSAFQQWLSETDPNGRYWRQVDQQQALDKTDAAVLLIAGWYDIFLNGQLADYAALLAAGRSPYLRILPSTHMDVVMDAAVQSEGIRQALWWFAIHLKGQHHLLQTERAVRFRLMNSLEDHEMDFWPPPADMTRYYLHSNGLLSPRKPEAYAPLPQSTSYIYDPADPTPSLGGPVLSREAGARDQRPLEARTDLLCFTTPPLDEDLDVIGHVRAEVFVRSSIDFYDLVGRLCLVESDGTSLNICEGIVRVTPEIGDIQADGSRKVEIDLWATAQRFRAGQSIRLHICSAAHPRWNANLGTDEPLGTGTSGLTAAQTIFHDALRPSAVILPLVNHSTRSRMAGAGAVES